MSRAPLQCADRSGFLFAHACDHPAAGVCSACGKPICIQHTRVTAPGPTCIACLRHDTDDEPFEFRDRGSRGSRSSDEPRDTAAEREGEFGGAGAGGAWQDQPAARADDPYFFPGADRAAYYDADDHAAFEPPAPASADDPAAAAAETDTGAS